MTTLYMIALGVLVGGVLTGALGIGYAYLRECAAIRRKLRRARMMSGRRPVMDYDGVYISRQQREGR